MRILLLQNGRPPQVDQFTGMPGMLAYFLDREFKRQGREVVYGSVASCRMDLKDSQAFYRDVNYPEADHALCVEQKAFFLRNFSASRKDRSVCPFYYAVRLAVSGAIATMCDKNDCLGCEDVTFFQVRLPDAPGSKYVGVAVDADLLTPAKPESLRILLDHSYAGVAVNQDLSTLILAQVCAWAKPRQHSVVIRQLGRVGVSSINPLAPIQPPSQVHLLNWRLAAEEYKAAHVFWVTHAESLGYSVLESAMAGALVVAPAGFIKPDILMRVEHIEYSGDPPWEEILSRCRQTEAIRAKAMSLDRWGELAGIITDCFPKGW